MRAGAFENDPLALAQIVLLGVSLDRRFDVARRHGLGIEGERGALLADGGELLVADVDRDHRAAKRGCDLRAVAADAADAVDDHEVAFRDAGLHDGLIGSGDRVGDHRDIGEIDAGGLQAVLVDNAQTARRDDDVGGEAAVNVVARHFLVRADGRLAAQAGVAAAARDDGGDDHRAVGVPKHVRAGFDDVTADFVAEAERQLVLGAHAVVVVAEVGVADAAAGDFDQHFVGARRADVEFHRDHRFARGGHHPTNGFDAHLTALRIGL